MISKEKRNEACLVKSNLKALQNDLVSHFYKVAFFRAHTVMNDDGLSGNATPCSAVRRRKRTYMQLKKTSQLSIICSCTF